MNPAFDPKNFGLVYQNRKALVFDSGLSVFFDDLNANMLVTGSTGTGKTTGVILPAVASLIGAGFGGLIIDIKGNMTPMIREIAARCGREDDVVEYGSYAGASRVNILLDAKANDFLTNLGVASHSKDSHNIDWPRRGARSVVHLAEFLRTASKISHHIRFDLPTMEQLVHHSMKATRLFHAFIGERKSACSCSWALFSKMIESNRFHLLNHPMSKSGEFQSDREYEQQSTWELGGIRRGLSLIMERPGVAANFFQGEKAFDIANLVHAQGKIVCLRMSSQDGIIGSLMSRHVLEAYYQSVYDNGLNLPADQYTFFAADEFQDFCDCDPTNRMNDASFISMSREFRNLSLISTQSVASMQAKAGAYREQVKGLVSNCNVRISFYSEDKETNDLFSQYDKEDRGNDLAYRQNTTGFLAPVPGSKGKPSWCNVTPAVLNRGEVIVIKKDAETDSHKKTRERCLGMMHWSFSIKDAIGPRKDVTMPHPTNLMNEEAFLADMQALEKENGKPIQSTDQFHDRFNIFTGDAKLIIDTMSPEYQLFQLRKIEQECRRTLLDGYVLPLCTAQIDSDGKILFSKQTRMSHPKESVTFIDAINGYFKDLSLPYMQISRCVSEDINTVKMFCEAFGEGLLHADPLIPERSKAAAIEALSKTIREFIRPDEEVPRMSLNFMDEHIELECSCQCNFIIEAQKKIKSIPIDYVSESLEDALRDLLLLKIKKGVDLQEPKYDTLFLYTNDSMEGRIGNLKSITKSAFFEKGRGSVSSIRKTNGSKSIKIEISEEIRNDKASFYCFLVMARMVHSYGMDFDDPEIVLFMDQYKDSNLRRICLDEISQYEQPKNQSENPQTLQLISKIKKLHDMAGSINDDGISGKITKIITDACAEIEVLIDSSLSTSRDDNERGDKLTAWMQDQASKAKDGELLIHFKSPDSVSEAMPVQKFLSDIDIFFPIMSEAFISISKHSENMTIPVCSAALETQESLKNYLDTCKLFVEADLFWHPTSQKILAEFRFTKKDE